MTADLSPEALDALVKSLRKGDKLDGRTVSCRRDQCNCVEMEDAADAITALRAENERLERARNEWRSDFRALEKAVVGETGISAMTVATQAKLFRPRAEEAESRATAAEAALATAMAGAVRVKPLAWQEFGDYGAKACAMLNSSYMIMRWNGRGEYEVSVSVPGHGSAFDGEQFHPTIEAAKAAAQEDYERRILAAIEPNPAAQDREALIAATLEMAASAVMEIPDHEYVGDEGEMLWSPPYQWDVAQTILSLATQPQTDALAARDAKMRAEGMERMATLVEEFAPGGVRYEAGHDDASMRVAIRGSILAAAQKEAGE